MDENHESCDDPLELFEICLPGRSPKEASKLFRDTVFDAIGGGSTSVSEEQVESFFKLPVETQLWVMDRKVPEATQKEAQALLFYLAAVFEFAHAVVNHPKYQEHLEAIANPPIPLPWKLFSLAFPPSFRERVVANALQDFLIDYTRQLADPQIANSRRGRVGVRLVFVWRSVLLVGSCCKSGFLAAIKWMAITSAVWRFLHHK